MLQRGAWLLGVGITLLRQQHTAARLLELVAGNGESGIKPHVHPVSLVPASSQHLQQLCTSCRAWGALGDRSHRFCPINLAAAPCHGLVSSKSSSYLLTIEERRAWPIAQGQLVASISSEM